MLLVVIDFIKVDTKFERKTMNSTNANYQPKKRKIRVVSSRFLWLVSVIAAIIFIIVFLTTPLFPFKWTLIVLLSLVILLGLTFLLSVKTKPRNMFTKTVNIIVTVALLVGAVVIPYEVDKVSNLFDQVVGQKVTINVYRMSDTYAKQNGFTETYSYSSDDEGKVSDLSSLKDAKFITSLTTDSDNGEYALMQLKNSFDATPKTIERNTFIDAANSLYSNEGDFMIMPSSYESVLEDSTVYANFAKDTQLVYTFTREIQATASVKGDTTLTSEPFTIFFGGNDQTGDLSTEGRTDVCMLVEVNPKTHQVAIINMPRDSYIPNPYYNNQYDKLTHLGLKGIENTLKGLGNYLDEPINNYVILNFDTFENIITALDGVTIDNPYEFTAIDGQHFDAGRISLDPGKALMYVRERENLPDGDFGRNMHQQIVMSAIIDKITSAQGILKFNDILDSISGQFLTNLSSKAIYGLVNKQLNEGMSWNIVKYHVLGDTGYEICASATGQELSVVYPYTNQVEFVKQVIDSIDNGEYVEQEELPEGSYQNTSVTTTK